MPRSAKTGFPGGCQAQIAVAVVIIPVVDIQLRIEIAQIDVIAIGINIICRLSPLAPEIEVCFPRNKRNHFLFSLNFIREQSFAKLGTPPPKDGKKSCLWVICRALPLSVDNGILATQKTRRLRGKTVAVPALQTLIILPIVEKNKRA